MNPKIKCECKECGKVSTPIEIHITNSEIRYYLPCKHWLRQSARVTGWGRIRELPPHWFKKFDK
jgi:hypothetical protein